MNFAMISLLMCVSLDVKVVGLDGAETSGKLVRIDQAAISLAASSGVLQFSLEEILRVDTVVDAATPASIGQAVFVDGSAVTTSSLITSGSTATMGRADGQKWEFDRKLLRSIRFNPPETATNESWQRLIGEPHQGDTIVIRKDKTLDYLEGVVRGIDNDQLEFELDGNTIEVARSKLEGVIFYIATPYQARSLCIVTTRTGDRLMAEKLQYANDLLELQLLGATLPIAAEDISRIDFGVGNLAYVSDLEPRQLLLTPWIAEAADPDSTLDFIYAPRMDTDFAGDPLTLYFPEEGRHQTFAKGMALHARTDLTYTIDPQWTRLRGWIGLDPRVTLTTKVELKVFGDRNLLFSTTMTSGQSPLQLDVNIDGAKTIKFVVDTANDGDLGDRVNLCNLRVTK